MTLLQIVREAERRAGLPELVWFDKHHKPNPTVAWCERRIERCGFTLEYKLVHIGRNETESEVSGA